MTVKECIKKNGWRAEGANVVCGGRSSRRWLAVNVSFLNANKLPDETSFDIEGYNSDELEELFVAFCKETGLPCDTVYDIYITVMARTFAALEKVS